MNQWRIHPKWPRTRSWVCFECFLHELALDFLQSEPTWRAPNLSRAEKIQAFGWRQDSVPASLLQFSSWSWTCFECIRALSHKDLKVVWIEIMRWWKLQRTGLLYFYICFVCICPNLCLCPFLLSFLNKVKLYSKENSLSYEMFLQRPCFKGKESDNLESDSLL